MPTSHAVKLVWRNTLTLSGAATMLLMLLFMVGFLIVDLVAEQRNPYIGVFTFLVFPVIGTLGFIATLLGLIRGRRRLKRLFGNGGGYQYYPRIDLAKPRHRRLLAATVGVAALVLPTVGVLSYQGYHYTDSNQFCGAVCHTVMQPQYTAYQHSAHAHVGCAECHIGSGASWYVKSKLSGIRQVFAVTLNTFPRPIPPAIQELRPATETCRQCHWPAKFFGDQLVTVEHYASDEANTHTQHRLLLKTGGSDPSTGPPSGIHWHMALGFTIEYVAEDKHLQEIPWVRMTDQTTGRQTVYRADGLKSSDPPPEGIHRTVDCMDCHNRPTHVFRSPDQAVNATLNINPILQTLPFAKRETVEAVAATYPNKSKAFAEISDAIARFYENQYPKIWSARKSDVDRLILNAKDIYSTNTFPEMNVNWRTYPNNIGHKIFPGCFRCHEGKHVADDGRSISRECRTCHDFLGSTADAGSPATPNATASVPLGDFVHPYKLEGAHATVRCDKCHTGGVSPDPTCAGCHSTVEEFRKGTLKALSAYALKPDPMADSVKCADCHDLSKPLTVEVMNERCMDCHSDDKEKFDGLPAAWHAEDQRILRSLTNSTDPAVKSVLDLLRKAGPHHNMEAARKISSALGVSPTTDASGH